MLVLAGQGTFPFTSKRRVEIRALPPKFIQTVWRQSVLMGWQSLMATQIGIPLASQNIWTGKYSNMLRGTLRRDGYCKGGVFIQLGMTDDSFQLELPKGTTPTAFMNAVFYLMIRSFPWEEKNLENVITDMDFSIFEKLHGWAFLKIKTSGLRTAGSPAQLLQAILEKDGILAREDKDMIVMQHLFEIKNGSRKSKNDLQA